MTGDNKNETGGEIARQGESFAKHILGLANAVPTAQSIIERQCCHDLVAFVALAGKIGIDPDDDLLLSLRPTALLLSKCELEAGFLFSSEQHSQLELGMRLGGRLVHSFLELLYQSSEVQRDRLTIEVEAHPLFHQQPTPENNHG